MDHKEQASLFFAQRPSKKIECVLRETLEMFVVLLMFSVKPCLRKKVSHLAETEETTLLAWGKKEREKWRDLWAEQKVLRLLFILQNQFKMCTE